MNAMDLQLSVFRETGVSGSDLRTAGGVNRSARPGAVGGMRTDGPSFSDVLAALTQKNAAPRTAPFSDRLRATEANVASKTAAIAARNDVAADATAADDADPETEKTPALDISTKEARAILRDALNADTISSDLLSALSDRNGDISETLLDLILADYEEDEDELGFGASDAALSEQLTDVLTDARKAQDLLSTQSGRELITAMSERSLANIVTAL